MSNETAVTLWTDLMVYDATEPNDSGTPITEMLDSKYLAVSEDGSLGEWAYYFVAEDGEEPSDTSPDGEIDWTGFREAVEKARAERAE